MTSMAIDTSWYSQPRKSDQEQKTAKFDQLITPYMKDLYRYGYWLSGDASIAEDLVQDTLLRAWRFLHKQEKPESTKGWLLTILRRENARRFERKHPQEVDIPMEALGETYQHYDTSTEAFVLRQAIKDLPNEYREPLILQTLHGYSQKEIAKKLGISAAGAGTRLFRARQKLREALA